MLKGFFENGERPNDGTEKDSKMDSEEKATFKRKYQECYLKYKLIAAGDSHSPSLLCIIRGDQLLNEVLKPLKLLCHMETKHPTLKDKPLGFFKIKKKCEQEEQKQLSNAFTLSNVCALRTSFLVVNHIANSKKLFTVGEELILPVAKVVCHELLGDAEVQNLACAPLSASTITRRTDETADILRPIVRKD